MGLGLGESYILYIIWILYQVYVLFSKLKKSLKQLNEAPTKNKKDPKLYFDYVGRLS